MQVNRRIVENYVQSFLDNIQIANMQAYWDENLHKPLLKTLHHKYHTWDNPALAVKWIKERPLFKRLVKNGYTYTQFLELLNHLKYVEKKAGDIIFKEKDCVYIVLNGRVVLRYHEEDPLEYQYIAQHIPGSVIYHSKLDSAVS